MYKEAVVAQFEVLPHHLFRGGQKNHEKLWKNRVTAQIRNPDLPHRTQESYPLDSNLRIERLNEHPVYAIVHDRYK
jgi:hypothetical protein